MNKFIAFWFILIVGLLGLVFVTAPKIEAKNKSVKGKIYETDCGIQYKIVEIEGEKFIATQSSNGYWNFAGPLREDGK